MRLCVWSLPSWIVHRSTCQKRFVSFYGPFIVLFSFRVFPVLIAFFFLYSSVLYCWPCLQHQGAAAAACRIQSAIQPRKPASSLYSLWSKTFLRAKFSSAGWDGIDQAAPARQAGWAVLIRPFVKQLSQETRDLYFENEIIENLAFNWNELLRGDYFIILFGIVWGIWILDQVFCDWSEIIVGLGGKEGMGEAINSDALWNFPPIFFAARLLTQKSVFFFFVPMNRNPEMLLVRMALEVVTYGGSIWVFGRNKNLLICSSSCLHSKISKLGGSGSCSLARERKEFKLPR